jgi:hypothetical protein
MAGGERAFLQRIAGRPGAELHRAHAVHHPWEAEGLAFGNEGIRQPERGRLVVHRRIECDPLPPAEQRAHRAGQRPEGEPVRHRVQPCDESGAPGAGGKAQRGLVGRVGQS